MSTRAWALTAAALTLAAPATVAGVLTATGPAAPGNAAAAAGAAATRTATSATSATSATAGARAAGTAASAGAADATAVLAGDVVPGLQLLSPLRPTDPARVLEVDLSLADPNPAGEAALYRAIYTPGSPDYHHFLTPAQYAARFAVPVARYDAALAFGTSHGLRLVSASAARDLIVLRGTAAAAERTFHVSLGDYTWKGLNFYANRTAPSVPVGLGITGVVGLNSAQRMHTTSHPTTAVLRAALATTVRPAQNFCAGPLCLGATTPQDLWGVYNQPATNEGQGQTMAIFGEGNFTTPVNDLRLFEKANGLPYVPVKVIETAGPTAKYTDTSGDGEWDLDVQASTGMAPQVQQLDLYFGTSLTDQNILTSFTTWADDPTGPAQASASFGECETSPVDNALPTGPVFSAGTAFTIAAEKVFQQANLEGRTLFASAGDTGSSCPILPVDVNGVGNEAYPAPNYPAASPHVVSVGGTVLYTNGATPAQRAVEYAWDFTGGGSSFYFPEPKFQQGIAGIAGQALPCLYPNGNPAGAGTPCRAVPDVAAQSGDILTNGYEIYSNGQPTETGGTSLSSPLWLGMWTRIQAGAAAAAGITSTTTASPTPTPSPTASPTASPTPGHRKPPNGHQGQHGAHHAAAPLTVVSPTTTTSSLTSPGNGFADEVLYRHPSDFFDIGGGVTSPPTSNGYFTSAPGWDYTSGLGTPNVSELMQSIDGRLTPVDDIASPNTPTLSVYAVEGGAIVFVSSSTGSTGSSGATTTTNPACVPLFVGDASSNYALDLTGSGEPQMAIVKGDMTNTATTLTTTLTVSNLTPSTLTLGTADEYYVYWTYNHVQYFTNVEISRAASDANAALGTAVLPAISYNYGTVAMVGSSRQYQNVGTVTGSVTYGTDGTLSVTVPLADIGSPPAGATLTGTGGETDELIGVPGVGGSLQPVDAAGPGNNYTLGETCSSTSPVGTSSGA